MGDVEVFWEDSSRHILTLRMHCAQCVRAATESPRRRRGELRALTEMRLVEVGEVVTGVIPAAVDAACAPCPTVSRCNRESAEEVGAADQANGRVAMDLTASTRFGRLKEACESAVGDLDHSWQVLREGSKRLDVSTHWIKQWILDRYVPGNVKRKLVEVLKELRTVSLRSRHLRLLQSLPQCLHHHHHHCRRQLYQKQSTALWMTLGMTWRWWPTANIWHRCTIHESAASGSRSLQSDRASFPPR